MFKQKKQSRWFDWLLIAVMSLFIMPAFAANGKGTISGQVVDTNGMPIAGVTVGSQSAAISTVTNPGGVFTLTGVKQKAKILVNFTKEAYVFSQATASLVRGATNIKENIDDENEGGTKLLKTTVVKVLLKSGAKQSLDAVTGGALTEAGFKATFAANSLTVPTGSVNVTISPLNGSTTQIKAAPGNLVGIDVNGKRLALKPYSMMDVSLSQNGKQVNLNAAASATIELLLPASTSLPIGSVKSMWYFETVKGVWKEEGTGTVKASTAIAGRKAVFATVKHFTFWAFVEPVSLTAVTGRVIDAFGLPFADAYIEARPNDNTTISNASVDALGNYCVELPSGVPASITAYGKIYSPDDGAFVSWVSANLNLISNAAVSSCDTGASQVAPDIVLERSLSCISGFVQDASGLPMDGVTVYSSLGTFTSTPRSNIAGSYTLFAPKNATVNVYATGYKSVTVMTSGDGSCVTADLKPSVGNACLSGIVFHRFNLDPLPYRPFPGFQAVAYDGNGTQFTSSPTTGADGRYCMDGLQAASVIPNVGVLDGASSALLVDPITNIVTYRISSVNVGAVLGSCATNSCNIGPDIYIDPGTP
jgi:hypothetical protein